ncbi:MAG: TetR/AcrR family transcriptional regulator [Clostridia bacterium]|nr:TetR/AcrR family transcriptional regulator [Clostridia bacterium]
MRKMSAREILVQTIKELMENQLLDDITVKDILDSSGLSRPTFYKYFFDKQDLMTYVFKKELADPFFWDFSKGLHEREVLFLKHLAKNRNFYLNALKTSGQNSLYDLWIDLACSSLHGYFRSTNVGARMDDADLVFASKYLAYAWVNMNINWLRDSDGLTAEEMERKLSAMMEHGLGGLYR